MLKIALILAVLPAVILAGRISSPPVSQPFFNEECADIIIINNSPFSFLGNAGGPTPNWAEVEGCNESECVVVNGATITLSAELPVSVPANALTTRVNAQWAIFNEDLQLPAEVVNGCNSFPGGCPLTVDSTEVISNSFMVAARFSNITPNIEFIMTNEAGERVICVRTSIRVISG